MNDLIFPARDLTSARFIRSISEPETGPSAANLVSNEDSYPRVCGFLREHSPADGLFIGVGPEQNLTLVAACRAVLAVMVDYRQRNLLVHLLHKALLALSADRIAYIEALTARRPLRDVDHNASGKSLIEAFDGRAFDRGRLDRTVIEVRRYLEPLGVVEDREWAEIATIQARLAGPGLAAKFVGLAGYPTVAQLIQTPDRDGHSAHFLSEEARYAFVRRMQLDDRILPIVGDFAGKLAFVRLGDELRRFRLQVSVIYVSDVEFFLLRSGQFPAYVNNLSGLPVHKDALIVRTSTRPINHAERVAGDSSTTVVRPLAPFLERARSGRIQSVDDLFLP